MSVQDVLDSLKEGRVEGMVTLNVKMSPELMALWATRDIDGYRLVWDWGEPDIDGFYTPTITRDYSDRLGEPIKTP